MVSTVRVFLTAAIGVFAMPSSLLWPSLAFAQENENAPNKMEQVPNEIRRDLEERAFRDNPPVFRASKTGLPLVVGGTAQPVLQMSVTARSEVTARRQLERLVVRVRDDPRFAEAVKNVERTEFLGGRSAMTDKDDNGNEVAGKRGRLRFYAYEIGRVVVVDIDEEGRVTDLRVRDKSYQASLSRGEVERAEMIVRQDPRAPKDLSRYTIARALVRPPGESGDRIAHVMFRTPDSLVWRYEAFVDLSTNQLREINRVK